MSGDERYPRWEDDLLRRPWAPRQTPRPAPAAGISDEPAVCLRVNARWWSHILGVLEVLAAPDAWAGDEAAAFSARQQIEGLLKGATCQMLDIRINDCKLEKTLDGGQTWKLVGDLSECLGKSFIDVARQRLKYLPNRQLVWYDPDTDNYRTFLWGSESAIEEYGPRTTPQGQPGNELRCRFTQSLMEKLIWAYEEVVRAKNHPTLGLALLLMAVVRAHFELAGMGEVLQSQIDSMTASILDNIGAFNATGTSDAHIRRIFCALLAVVPDNGIITTDIKQDMIDAIANPSNVADPGNGFAALIDGLGAQGVQNAGAANPTAFVMDCLECDDQLTQGTRPFVVTFGDPLAGLPVGWPHYTVQNAVRIPNGGHIGPYALVNTNSTMSLMVRFPQTTFPGLGSMSFRWKSWRPMGPAAAQIRARAIYYAPDDTVLWDSNGGWMNSAHSWQLAQLYHAGAISGANRALIQFYKENNANGSLDFGIDHVSIN